MSYKQDLSGAIFRGERIVHQCRVGLARLRLKSPSGQQEPSDKGLSADDRWLAVVCLTPLAIYTVLI